MNTQHVTLSEYLNELDLSKVVKDLTGYEVGLSLDFLFDRAGIGGDFHTVDPLKTIIAMNYFDAVRAAFVAGAIVGLDPERLLLARLSAAADRLEDAVDRLEGAQ